MVLKGSTIFVSGYNFRRTIAPFKGYLSGQSIKIQKARKTGFIICIKYFLFR